MTARLYRYVGPLALKGRRRGMSVFQVRDIDSLRAWIRGIIERGDHSGESCVTFIIDQMEELWIADRRSEHIACADGQDVLAAGEMTLELSHSGIIVSGVTNQSTGYCPEPDSWDAVARVLDRLRVPRPDFFTTAFQFRRCGQCGETNLIKEEIFECAICGQELDRSWNFA